MISKEVRRIAVCKSMERYGKSHIDCEWEFRRKSNNEQFCDPCKPFCAMLRQRIAQMKYDTGGVPKPKDLNFEWTASHLHKRCTACGRKGVPIQNRMLCVACYTGDREYVIEHDTSAQAIHDMVKGELVGEHGEVRHYVGLSQEEFEKILDS